MLAAIPTGHAFGEGIDPTQNSGRPFEDLASHNCDTLQTDAGYHAWELGLAHLKDKGIIKNQEQCRRFAPALETDDPDKKDFAGLAIRKLIAEAFDLIPYGGKFIKYHAAAQVFCACKQIDFDDPNDGFVSHRDKKMRELEEYRAKAAVLTGGASKAKQGIQVMAKQADQCGAQVKTKQAELKATEQALKKASEKWRSLDKQIGALERRISDYDMPKKYAGIFRSITPGYKKAEKKLNALKDNAENLRAKRSALGVKALERKVASLRKAAKKFAVGCGKLREKLVNAKNKANADLLALTPVLNPLNENIQVLEYAEKFSSIFPGLYETLLNQWVIAKTPDDYTEVGTERGGGSLYYVNGINTKFEKEDADDEFQAMDEALKLSSHLERRVRILYNPTESAAGDLSEAGVDKLWYPPAPQLNKTTKELAGIILYHAERNEPISLVGHSQGSMIVNNALKTATFLGFSHYLNEKVKWIASGTPIRDDEFSRDGKVTIVKNSRDPISLVGSAEDLGPTGFTAEDGINRREHSFYDSYILKLKNAMLWN